MVLFLFVIMLLDLKSGGATKDKCLALSGG